MCQGPQFMISPSDLPFLALLVSRCATLRSAVPLYLPLTHTHSVDSRSMGLSPREKAVARTRDLSPCHLQVFRSLSTAPLHAQPWVYVLHSSTRLIAFIYLLGISWRTLCHESLSLLEISPGWNDGASCISMCGLFYRLGNLVLTQSLIWEATSAILFTFSHWAPETTLRLP